MSFGSTPKPDPAATAAAAQQKRLADAQLTDSLQTGIVGDTRSRLRQFGIQPATGYTGVPGGVAGQGGGWGPFGGIGGFVNRAKAIIAGG